MRPATDIDRDVRVALFAGIVREGSVPAPDEVARAAGVPPAELAASYRRLADAHVLVLAPGREDEIWMANPFSATTTPFAVEVDDRAYHGNCIWDALGIVAMLGGTGSVRFPCPDCGEPLAIDVRGGEPESDLLVHFAVPAARWWEDIGFT